jgi:pimeloyl-ACP methyl ester carboxylesterase
MSPVRPLLAHRAFGSGPPLILIHGLSGSGRWWSRNVAALAAEHRVYAIDLPGFGASRRSGPFRLESAVTQIVHWMDATGIDRASFAGHSLGGLIAVLLAAAAPERIDRLVLVDAALLEFDPGLRNRVRGVARSLRTLSPRILPLIVSDALRSGPFAFAGATRALLLAGVPAALSRIGAPTLVVWGEFDTIVPLTVGETIVRKMPHARLAVIPGAGHNAMWDRPDAFSRLVLDFLSDDLSAGADRASRSAGGPGDAGPEDTRPGPTA